MYIRIDPATGHVPVLARPPARRSAPSFVALASAVCAVLLAAPRADAQRSAGFDRGGLGSGSARFDASRSQSAWGRTTSAVGRGAGVGLRAAAGFVGGRVRERANATITRAYRVGAQAHRTSWDSNRARNVAVGLAQRGEERVRAGQARAMSGGAVPRWQRALLTREGRAASRTIREGRSIQRAGRADLRNANRVWRHASSLQRESGRLTGRSDRLMNRGGGLAQTATRLERFARGGQPATAGRSAYGPSSASGSTEVALVGGGARGEGAHYGPAGEASRAASER